jgi:hypothetical protein
VFLDLDSSDSFKSNETLYGDLEEGIFGEGNLINGVIFGFGVKDKTDSGEFT